MKNPEQDPTVGQINGQTVRVEPGTGAFYIYQHNKITEDKTLAGLQKKLDERIRTAARQKAKDLPAVVWKDDAYRSPGKWLEGYYGGVNAHTGAVTLMVNGVAQTIGTSATWFRKGHPELPTIKRLVEAEQAALQAHEAAEKALADALQQHGCQIRLDYSGNKGKRAAEAEARLVAYLEGKEGTP